MENKEDRKQQRIQSAQAAAVLVEPGAHHRLHGFKRHQLARLVQQAGAARVTVAAAAQWQRDPATAPDWLQVELQRRAAVAAAREERARLKHQAAEQRVIERLRRGAHHFRRWEDQQIVADIAFRAWKELQRGLAVDDLLPEERTALRWGGVTPIQR